ncbi:MAG: AAA family ATPase, partial [Selenomonadaceae bacterium]|nr:AAA family ATPase [Selenomonadaceae bacterium]
EKKYFSDILNETVDADKMQFALSNLMEGLEKHHGKKPILLLDEYDAPILSAWENGYYKECIEFMRGFLGSALKTNPSLHLAVLTGVTRVSKESIFSGLNNLDVCGVLSDSYSDAFGFTQEEAAKLMEECGVADKLPDLRRWYDGYLFGQTEIYNPWSVINFIKNGCKFRPYWLNTSGNSILKDLLERVDERRKRELEGLMQGRPVEAPVLENLVYGDIHSNRDMLFMMLMTAGYLKPVEVWQDEEYMEWAKLQIPNVEIRTAYRREILNHIVPSQGGILLRDMMKSMASGDVAGFSEVLSEILRDFVSYHDIAQPETFYHGLMLGLSVLMEGDYRVESNRESGYGRFDITFFPLKPGTPGVILELKSVKSEEELEETAKAALRQIGEKSYIAELARQGVKEVWKYGIAFCGKKVQMERG